MDKTASFAVRLESITLRLGEKPVFKDYSQSFSSGMVTGLTGGNGSGKTSLLNLISGIYLPQAGKIMLRNTDVTNMPSWKRSRRFSLSRSFQIPCLADSMPALDNVIVSRLGGYSLQRILLSQVLQAELRTAAHDFWKSLCLPVEWLSCRAGSLSYGQRRIIDVARCLFSGCSILLLDEPFANIHREVAERIRNLIKTTMTARPESAVVVVAHEQDLLDGLADRIVEL
jgi:ABC-type branched-subunit amino acid transport system ATPase component